MINENTEFILRITHLDKSQKLILQAHKTLLENLEQQNIAIRKGCDNGTCGICLTQLLNGSIDYKNRKTYGLNKTEIDQGYILPCIAYCHSDITIMPPKVKLKRE